MRFLIVSATLSAALLGSVILATGSHAAGLSGLHTQAQIGNRICMVDHVHHGQSGAWATKDKAVATAAQSWGSFTEFEYGTEWASFNQAHQPEMNCEQVESERGGVLWTCKAKAKPCRLQGAVTAAAAEPTPAVVTRRTPRLRQHARLLANPPVLPAHAHPRAHHAPRAALMWPGDKR